MIKDKYDIGLLKSVLGKEGFEFIYFPKTDSTMRIIEEFAQKGKKSFIIVLTDHQSKGVGRMGRKWIDAPGRALMFSVLFQIKESTIATFADLVALTVCETLSEISGNLQVKIKYPNDLVVKDKKIGGILVKNIYGEKLNYLGTNLGIGVNIHYTRSMLEKLPVDYPATSLDTCNNTFNKRQELLIEIVKSLKYLGTEAEVIEANPLARKLFEEKWKQASSMIRRNVAILKQDEILEKGLVTDTKLGQGIELQTRTGKKWFSLFDTDMKARILN